MKQKHTSVLLIRQKKKNHKKGFQTFINYQEQYKNLHRKKITYLKHLF